MWVYNYIGRPFKESAKCERVVVVNVVSIKSTTTASVRSGGALFASPIKCESTTGGFDVLMDSGQVLSVATSP